MFWFTLVWFCIIGTQLCVVLQMWCVMVPGGEMTNTIDHPLSHVAAYSQWKVSQTGSRAHC